jgi:hypothetical protein
MRHWRWAVVAGAIALACSIPVVSANWPVAAPRVDLELLRTRVAASAEVPFEGLYRSRGGLRLPDLGRLDDEVAPFRETVRVRVWYAAPDRWRADELLVGGERGTYREPGNLILWDSGRRRVIVSPRADPDLEPARLPRLMDLSPPELGRRLLLESDDDRVSALPARRVAGRAAAGIRIVPESAVSTIRAVNLWADPTTGVVLKVELDTGASAPVLETEFVTVHLRSPDPDVVAFDDADGRADVETRSTVDPIETIGNTRLLALPDSLAGLPRRNDPEAGLATYGEGMAVVTLLAVPRGALGRRIDALPRAERVWGGQAALIETSLVNAQLARIGGLEVVLAGTVTVAELDRIAGELVAAVGPAALVGGTP